jgi:hypothetical protein
VCEFYFIEFFSARRAAAVSDRLIARIHPASVHTKSSDATGLTCLPSGTAYSQRTRQMCISAGAFNDETKNAKLKQKDPGKNH